MYGIRFVPKETNKTSSMSNKNRNLREHKTDFKNKTYNLKSNNLSNSVKYWSFTLLIMHYFVYGSLYFSLCSDFCADSQLCGLSAAHLCSLTFCLQFWYKSNSIEMYPSSLSIISPCSASCLLFSYKLCLQTSG